MVIAALPSFVRIAKVSPGARVMACAGERPAQVFELFAMREMASAISRPAIRSLSQTAFPAESGPTP